MATSIGRLVSGLLEKTEKETVMLRFDEVFTDLKEHVLPMSKLPDDTGAKTRTMRLLEARFSSRNLPVEGYRKGVIKFIRGVAEKMVKEEAEYRKIFEGRFKDDVLKEALDYESAQLLHFLKAVDFFNQYTRKLMLMLHHQELDLPMKSIDREYLEYVESRQALDSYAIICSACNVPVKTFGVMMTKLKDISFDVANEDTIQRIRGKKSVDPLSMGLVPILGDIFLFFGELKNTYTKYRYDLATEEKQRLEMQVLYLQRKKAGASGEELARIQKQIDYYTNRINALQGKIEDIEEDAKGYEYD